MYYYTPNQGVSIKTGDWGKLRLNLPLASLKNGLKDKWRLAFLAFAVAYGLFLVFGVSGMSGLSNMSIQWDEVTHLNGGALLLRGDFQTYFSFNAFYPPMYDLVTMTFFSVGGVSVFTGRFVSVAFSLFSVYTVFEFGYRIYGARTALLASILLAVMPGYLWLSRMAMIETMLVFFFTVSALFFFLWLHENKTKFLIFSGVALGLGIITKYQMIIVAAIMLTALFLLGRGFLKKKLRRFPLLILTLVAVVVPWIVVSYQLYAGGMLNQWLYALNIGNPGKSLYSTGLQRFPPWFDGLPNWVQTPIFYLLEMNVPYSDVHPVSLLLYGVGLAGLGWLAWRRKPADKYLLIWFFVVYIFFTAIPNKQWRYVVPLFPVLALSGAALLASALGKAQKTWTAPKLSVSRKRLVQVAAVALVVFTFVGVYASLGDAYYWVAKDQIQIPIDAATSYVAQRIKPDESILVLCSQNLFSQDMVRFYLYANGKNNKVVQFPTEPVDTYTPPAFNESGTQLELVDLCRQNNVKYVFMYEYGGEAPYFNSNESLMTVYYMLNQTGTFANLPILAQADDGSYYVVSGVYFGKSPWQIYIVDFTG